MTDLDNAIPQQIGFDAFAAHVRETVPGVRDHTLRPYFNTNTCAGAAIYVLSKPESRKALALDALTTELATESSLYGYAAEAAADVLVQNWKQALKDGADLATLAGDVGDVIDLLRGFQQSVTSYAAAVG